MRTPRKAGPVAPTRLGAALLIVIVSLALVGAALVSVMQLAAADHQRAFAKLQRARLDWLTESAIERGAAKLQADGGYAGEIWSVSASDIGAPWDGNAKIEIAPAASDPASAEATVTASWSGAGAPPGRVEKRVMIATTSKGDSP